MSTCRSFDKAANGYRFGDDCWILSKLVNVRAMTAIMAL